MPLKFLISLNFVVYVLMKFVNKLTNLNLQIDPKNNI